MSLDVFAPAIAASDQNVAANAAANLPAGFGESFDIAWRSGTEFHNSAAYSIARERALVDYNDDVFQKTGERLPYVGVGDGDVSLDTFNEAQAKLQQKVPGLDYLAPLSEGDVNAMTLRRMAKAHSDAAAFQSRETTWGGTAGTVAGTLAGGLADPVMLATAPLGGAGEAGIALRALEFAAISGGSEAISAGLGYKSREAAVPGSSKEIPGEIAGATLSGALFGGAFGALGKVLGWGAKTLPTTVRDEVNAAASEFQFHATNPFPTAAGETAARDATVEATTSLAKGETVTAADNFDIGHVADYALAAKADTPEKLAMAGEAHLRPETIGERPDVEAFDRMPSETDDAASYWEQRLEGASAEERAALGATDAARVEGYHGSPVPFTEFSEKGPYYFTPHPEVAGEYATTTYDEGFARLQGRPFEDETKRPHIVRANLQMEKPFTADMWNLEEASKARDPEWLKANGYDSAILNDARDPTGTEFIVLDRSQIEPKYAGQLEIPARDLTPEQVTHLAAEPATSDAVLHNFEHIAAANPEMEFTTQVLQPDGSYRFETQKLSDVMAEFDGWEAAAKEIEACAVGGALEAAE